MPVCGASGSCLHPELPLDGRHFCGICRSTHLHGPCGVYLGNDDEITYRNACLSCIEQCRRNIAVLPPPTVTVQQNVAVSESYNLPVIPPSTQVLNVAAADRPSQALKCSLRQCKNTDAAALQFTCGFKDCGKTIHRPCYMAFIAKNNLLVLPDEKFCCGVKAHHSSVLKAAANPVNEKTRWDADGPNGPDTEPSSMSVLLDWWTVEGNYSKYRGGKDQTGKTKETFWQMLSQLIKEKGILVERSAVSVGSKIIRMEAMYKDAADWLAQTGQGVLAEGGDVTDAVKKRCPFFYIIDPIMRDRPSIKPLALSDELDWENLENESTEMEVTDLSDFPGVDDSVDEPTMVTITTRTGDEVTTETIVASSEADEGHAAVTRTPVMTNNNYKPAAANNKTPKASNTIQRKRLLTVSGTASSQKKKKLDPFTVMSQLSGSLQELGSSTKVNEKMYELEKSYKTEELRLKGRELAILEKKSETEINLLKIKEKKELLLARKELKDIGVSQEEIDQMLPIT